MDEETVKQPQPTARLLVPIDTTERSLWGIRYAIQCARPEYPVEVCLLYIMEPVENWEVLHFHTPNEVRERFEERASIFLANAAHLLAEAGIDCKASFREGEMVNTILTFAETKACSTIVVPCAPLLGLFGRDLGSKLSKHGKHLPIVCVDKDGTARP